MLAVWNLSLKHQHTGNFIWDELTEHSLAGMQCMCWLAATTKVAGSGWSLSRSGGGKERGCKATILRGSGRHVLEYSLELDVGKRNSKHGDIALAERAVTAFSGGSLIPHGGQGSYD